MSEANDVDVIVMPTSHKHSVIEVLLLPNEDPEIIGIRGGFSADDINSISWEVPHIDLEHGVGAYLLEVLRIPMQVGDRGGVIEDEHWEFEQIKYEPLEA